MKIDTNTLVEQAKRGEKKAFTQLYDRYHKLIRYIIYDIVKDDDLTKDLVSNTFIKAFNKLDSYINPLSFEAWLKTIAVNTTIDYIRASKDLQKNISIDDEESNFQIREISPDPESDMIKTEDIDLLKIALSRLRSKYRNLLEVRYFKDLSYEQLSVELGIPVGTIKSDLNKAKRKLRVIFQKLSKI